MDGILSGCVVTPSAPADMNVHVAAGNALFGSSVVAVAGGQLAIAAANATYDRIDRVYVDADGTIEVAQGTAATNPTPPAPDAGGDLEIALVYVPAGVTAISSSLIGDRRQITHEMVAFNGRTGAVVPQAGDYAPSDVGLPPAAAPAALTDSTGGTPAATLVAVRSDTAAHTAADANANIASLNAKYNALVTALKATNILT